MNLIQKLCKSMWILLLFFSFGFLVLISCESDYKGKRRNIVEPSNQAPAEPIISPNTQSKEIEGNDNLESHYKKAKWEEVKNNFSFLNIELERIVKVTNVANYMSEIANKDLYQKDSRSIIDEYITYKDYGDMIKSITQKNIDKIKSNISLENPTQTHIEETERKIQQLKSLLYDFEKEIRVITKLNQSLNLIKEINEKEKQKNSLIKDIEKFLANTDFYLRCSIQESNLDKTSVVRVTYYKYPSDYKGDIIRYISGHFSSNILFFSKIKSLLE